MDDGGRLRALLTWLFGTEDEAGLCAGLGQIAPGLWPAFSAEAGDELRRKDRAHHELHGRLLGEERRRREY